MSRPPSSSPGSSASSRTPHTPCENPRIAAACIDIGSNTTRLLVADAPGGRLRELASRREFTRIGRSVAEGGGVIPPAKLAETADVVAEHARLARELGARQIEVVATAAIREARNGAELAELVGRRAGVVVRVLTGPEEARLAFAGATRTLAAPVEDDLAVVDVGGGSTEVAVGTVAGGMSWCDSFRLGSGTLADAHLRSDPPARGELSALRGHVRDAFERLEAPPVRSGVAVGGSATSLRTLAGPSLVPAAFEHALSVLCSAPAEEVGRRLGLEPERVRLMPAGMAVLQEVGARLGMPLTIARGGLREGILFELLEPDGVAG